MWISASPLSSVHSSWTLSPATVNQARFGFTRRGFHRASLRTGQPASLISKTPNLPSTAFGDVLPTYLIAGMQQLGIIRQRIEALAQHGQKLKTQESLRAWKGHAGFGQHMVDTVRERGLLG